MSSETNPIAAVDWTLRIISSTTIVLSCISAFAELAHVFTGWSSWRPQTDLPVGLSFVIMYVTLVLLVFSTLVFFNRANLTVLLFAPVVVFAVFYFGLQVRSFLFSHWLSAAFSDPTDTRLGRICIAAPHSGHTVWNGLSHFQFGMMSLLFVGIAFVLGMRIWFRQPLEARSIIYATGAIVVPAMFFMTLRWAHYGKPEEIGFPVVIALPYIYTTEVFVAQQDLAQASPDGANFWLLGCFS